MRSQSEDYQINSYIHKNKSRSSVFPGPSDIEEDFDAKKKRRNRVKMAESTSQCVPDSQFDEFIVRHYPDYDTDTRTSGDVQV